MVRRPTRMIGLDARAVVLPSWRTNCSIPPCKERFGFVFDRSSAKVISTPGFKNAKFAKPVCQQVELNSVVMVKWSGRLERDERPVCLDLPMIFRVSVFSALEGHVINIAVARNSTLNQSERALTHLAPTPWRPPEYFVSALSEFAAGMKVGQHQFNRGHVELGMHVHGDAAAIVTDGTEPSMWIAIRFFRRSRRDVHRLNYRALQNQ